MEPIVRTAIDNSWIFGTLLGIIVLLGISRLAFSKYYNTLGDMTLFVEAQENFVPFAVLVHVALACMIGLIIYPFVEIDYNFMKWSNVIHGYLLIGIVLLYFIVRFTINTVLLFLLGLEEQYKKILKTKLYFRFFALIGLLICCFLLYYSEFDSYIILYVALGILVLTLLLEYFFQLSKNGLTGIYVSYYFILYLCILEILPVLYVLNHWSR